VWNTTPGKIQTWLYIETGSEQADDISRQICCCWKCKQGPHEFTLLDTLITEYKLFLVSQKKIVTITFPHPFRQVLSTVQLKRLAYVTSGPPYRLSLSRKPFYKWRGARFNTRFTETCDNKIVISHWSTLSSPRAHCSKRGQSWHSCDINIRSYW
jgi:hypothetical protein